MKRILYFLITIIILAGCGAGSSLTGTTREDKALITAIKKLNKSPQNTSYQAEVKNLYDDALKMHLNNIQVFETLTGIEKWDKIIQEYNALERMYNTVYKYQNALRVLKPSSYNAEAQVARQQAASDYYDLALSYNNENTKESSRSAYYAFKKALDFVPDYQDAKKQMQEAYENSVINVVINPVADDSYYYNSIGRNRFGNSFNNDYLQRNLVRDLGGSSSNSPAHFFSDLDARRLNVTPDWIIDLTWVNLDIPRPYTQKYNREVSKQIQIGTDTSKMPVYKTVSATLHITRQYFTAIGDLECRITDAQTGDNINLNRYSSRVDWQQEYATYSGDFRALSAVDVAILNNRNYRLPRREDILNELYQNIYPQVKSGIYNSVRW